MKLSEVAREVVALAEAARSYQDAELPKRHPHYPFVDPWESADAPSDAQSELKGRLSSLPDDLIYQLALVMYLGRGDFGVDNLAGRYEAVRKSFAEPAWAVAQMVEKAPLADYLSDGLAELARHGIDVDHLTRASAASAGGSLS